MIDLSIDHSVRTLAARRARQRGLVIPTLAQMRSPATIPQAIRARLRSLAMSDVDPANLFRINWHNQPVERGGDFGQVNRIEFPPSLTGVEARIIALVGKWFPTGCHKVGASFGCLAPRLVSGQFDPARQRAVWPSTGNFCRGGAYDSALLGCTSVAVLPEGMSRERFDWLARLGGEIIRTPGSESNIKAIYDTVRQIRQTRPDAVVFNQFEDFGNYLWHYSVTGPAMAEVLERSLAGRGRAAGLVLATGSAGTIASGDFLKQRFPGLKIAAGEASQCPTLLENGFGDHRIEGIGDRHVPWIHNVRNTDMVIAVDDETVVSLARLFNEPAGRGHLLACGVPEDVVARLDWLGLSGIANLAMSIKFAKYWELAREDIVITVLTDSMDLYGSRLAEMRQRRGEYADRDAIADRARHLLGLATDNLLELTHVQRRRVHNLKYFTWIEQQGRDVEELNRQWHDPTYWTDIQSRAGQIDELISEFNALAGAAS